MRKTAVVMVTGLVVVVGASARAGKEEKLALDKLPQAVANAVKARFPDAKLKGAEKEEEDGETIYEVGLVENSGQKVDVSLVADGTIKEIERELEAADLPKPVRETVSAKYAGGKVKIVEEVILVKEGKEQLDCYEFKIAKGDKVTEVKIAADGKVKKEEAEDADDSGEAE